MSYNCAVKYCKREGYSRYPICKRHWGQLIRNSQEYLADLNRQVDLQLYGVKDLQETALKELRLNDFELKANI